MITFNDPRTLILSMTTMLEPTLADAAISSMAELLYDEQGPEALHPLIEALRAEGMSNTANSIANQLT